MTEILMKAAGVHKSYHDGTHELHVLRGVDLTVAKSQTIAVIGMSGSGKSTLLHMLGGLDAPDKGTVEIGGRDLTSMSHAERAIQRNRAIGFVFQFHHLLPEFNALENVVLPAMLLGRTKRQIEPEAKALLDRLGLGGRLRHRPAKLSGGEQQRVALARALVNQPSVLLADEPTGNLDMHTGEKVIEMMWDLTAGQGRALVIVTHEPSIALRAQKIYQLIEGRLKSIGHAALEEQVAAVRG